jgi:hypothetical protein
MCSSKGIRVQQTSKARRNETLYTPYEGRVLKEIKRSVFIGDSDLCVFKKQVWTSAFI